jgi:DNA-binding PadR family transcriptional regulator
MNSDMRRHWFFILLSLADRDRHGSGIVRDVLDLTGGDLRLWPVTLYGSLDELRENSWIREIDSGPDDDENRGHRRWFRITPQGRRALVAEIERMNTLVTVAQRRLASAGGSQ